MKDNPNLLDSWETERLAQLITQECSGQEYWQDKEERTALPPSMSDLMF